MRIYQVKLITGFYIGQYGSLNWTDRKSTVTPLQHAPMLGIFAEILQAYYEYLWRLGEHTFGARYAAGFPLPRGVMSIEKFADYFILKLWPEYGRFWSAVGATVWRFGGSEVIGRDQPMELVNVGRMLLPYDIIMRYRERLWWARAIFIAAANEWMYEVGPVIGEVLMFERRGYGVARKNEDSWNFGMLWWEVFGVPGNLEVYLWEKAEVRYLGFGVRVSPTLLKIQKKK